MLLHPIGAPTADVEGGEAAERIVVCALHQKRREALRRREQHASRALDAVERGGGQEEKRGLHGGK